MHDTPLTSHIRGHLLINEHLDMGSRLTMVVGLLQHGDFLSTWDFGSSVFFSITVHNYPWDGIWLYIKR
jgi:hypothetical protein